MPERTQIRLPRQWPEHVESGLLHAISLASTAWTIAQARAASQSRLRAELDQAKTEIALLREELDIKDGRWERARTRRRPHYSPTQRLRILELRAARGWNLEKTAKVFLLSLHTVQLWMRRLDEYGERELVQTPRPVNRYPDFVRHLVRQLKRLCPSMGSERQAQILARLGLILSESTVRRMRRELSKTPRDHSSAPDPKRRRAVARKPGDVWHIDLTAVSTRAGFWVPWFPFSLPQRWPFCWWVAVVVDQASRAFVGFAVFTKLPTSEQVQALLNRAVRKQGHGPRCIVSDKGKQFDCRSFKRWCGRHSVRRRFGYLGEPASIAITERFIRSMKEECFRPLVPMTIDGMRRELRWYSDWYNEQRPHTTLDGKTPNDIINGRTRRRRIETRSRWPHRPRSRSSGGELMLDVSYVAGRKHLPVIELCRAA